MRTQTSRLEEIRLQFIESLVSLPIPSDPILDPPRLAAVAATGQLDTANEPAFDDLTRMAAVVIGAPFAFATLVDDTRSFWKSSFGLAPDAPRQNTVEESFCQYVVRSREALIVSDTTLDARTCDNPSIVAMGVRAWAGFPLVAPSGEVLGSFCIVDTVPRPWTNREMEVLATLARAASREIALRAAVQDEREARQRAELLAQTLQQTLLPPALPDIDGLNLAVRFHPAGTGVELAGDFYDVFASRPGKWSFIVGDVCGKGVEAAKVAAFARHVIGALAMQRSKPSEVLAWLNAALLARGFSRDVFLTAVYGTIEVCGPRAFVRLACAGHPAPIVRRSDGTTTRLDAMGPLVGSFRRFEVADHALTLESDDALIIVTDGVVEARDAAGTLIDENDVLALIACDGAPASADSLAARVERAALAFYGGPARDDIAVLVMVPHEPRVDETQRRRVHGTQRRRVDGN